MIDFLGFNISLSLVVSDCDEVEVQLSLAETYPK